MNNQFTPKLRHEGELLAVYTRDDGGIVSMFDRGQGFGLCKFGVHHSYHRMVACYVGRGSSYADPIEARIEFEAEKTRALPNYT